jgi:hypothetical protein
MAALVAADRSGGDHRGRLAAGIRIARRGHEGHWFELCVDESDDAVNDLVKKYVEIEHAAKGNWTSQPFKYPCPNYRVTPLHLTSIAGKCEHVRHVTVTDPPVESAARAVNADTPVAAKTISAAQRAVMSLIWS